MTLHLETLELAARAALAEATGSWREGSVETDKVFALDPNSLGPERVLLQLNRHFPHQHLARYIAMLHPVAVLDLVVWMNRAAGGFVREVDRLVNEAIRRENAIEQWKEAASHLTPAPIKTPADLIARLQRHVEVMATTLRERDDACTEVDRLENELINATLVADTIPKQPDTEAMLMRYIDNAKKAAGSERIAGEPVAEFITRILEELRALRAEVGS